jgi:hypothetical protein
MRRRGFFLLPFAASLLVGALFFWPVRVFRLESSRARAGFPVPLGQILRSRFIHSVQLSPVEDDYIVTARGLWTLEERTRTFSAGLPTEAPRNGAFLVTREGYTVLDRRRVDPLFYRVGNGRLGRNTLTWMPPGGAVPVFLLVPGARLTLGTELSPLGPVLWRERGPERAFGVGP